MGPILGGIGIVLGVIILGLVIFVATRPGAFRIERSARMGVGPDAVFAKINDFHAWREWSPWEALDPAMQKTFEGPASGVGAVFAWSGNKKAGSGRMTMLESKPGEMVRIKLEFFKPFVATNEATLTLTPTGEETLVEWAMTGTNGFMSKAFCMFMDVDKMVGKDFEKGLANLERVAREGVVQV